MAARASCWRSRRPREPTTATRSSCGCSAGEPEGLGSEGSPVSVPLHVVEPTLEDYSGHCHALVSSLVRAAQGRTIELWKGEAFAPMTFGPNVTVHSHFRRRERRQQMLRLLHRLLRTPNSLVLTTARALDLALVALVAPGRLPP